MDYPHITINAQSASGEDNILVTLTVGGTLPVDEAALVQVIENHLLGLPSVANSSAAKHTVAQQAI